MRELNMEETGAVEGGIIPVVIAIALLDGFIYGAGAAAAGIAVYEAVAK